MQEAAVKQPDEIFCHSCGSRIKAEAEICVHCGVRVRRAAGSGAKSKVAAILLAVFLGFWTWLYTYREDGWKFWLALGVSILNVILAVATAGLWMVIGVFISLGFWVWPIVDAAVKNDDWYSSY